MTDFTGAGAPTSPLDTSGQDEDSQPGIRILAQYVRDLSFENPRAPDSLRAGTVPPQIDLGVELGARGRDDGLFEIELKLTARAMRETESVFHIELAYAGLFQLTAVPPEEMESVLMIECPRYLFPFARRIIADLSSEGGFPPFMLEPIDFAALYIARRSQSVGETVGNA